MLSSDFSSASLYYTVANSSDGTTLVPWTFYTADIPIRLACADDGSTCGFTLQARATYKTWVASPIATVNVTVNASLDNLAPRISGTLCLRWHEKHCACGQLLSHILRLRSL